MWRSGIGHVSFTFTSGEPSTSTASVLTCTNRFTPAARAASSTRSVPRTLAS